MNNQLTTDDIDVIMESLKYSKRAIEDYQNHPTHEFKRNQLERIETALTKLRSLRDKARK